MNNKRNTIVTSELRLHTKEKNNNGVQYSNVVGGALAGWRALLLVLIYLRAIR